MFTIDILEKDELVSRYPDKTFDKNAEFYVVAKTNEAFAALPLLDNAGGKKTKNRNGYLDARRNNLKVLTAYINHFKLYDLANDIVNGYNEINVALVESLPMSRPRKLGKTRVIIKKMFSRFDIKHFITEFIPINQTIFVPTDARQKDFSETSVARNNGDRLRNTTYIKSDYIALTAMLVALQVVTPIWIIIDHQLPATNNQSQTYLNKLGCISDISFISNCDAEMEDDPSLRYNPYQKLALMVLGKPPFNKQNKKDNTDLGATNSELALITQMRHISIDELPNYYIARVLNELMTRFDVTINKTNTGEESNAAKNITKQIGKVTDELSKDVIGTKTGARYVESKLSQETREGEDKDIIDLFRSKQKRSDADVDFNVIMCEDIDMVGNWLGVVDRHRLYEVGKMLNRRFEHIRTERSVDKIRQFIEPTYGQYVLMKNIVQLFIDPGDVREMNASQLNSVRAACAMYLYENGQEVLATILLAYPQRTQDGKSVGQDTNGISPNKETPAKNKYQQLYLNALNTGKQKQTHGMSVKADHTIRGLLSLANDRWLLPEMPDGMNDHTTTINQLRSIPFMDMIYTTIVMVDERGTHEH